MIGAVLMVGDARTICYKKDGKHDLETGLDVHVVGFRGKFAYIVYTDQVSERSAREVEVMVA